MQNIAQSGMLVNPKTQSILHKKASYSQSSATLKILDYKNKVQVNKTTKGGLVGPPFQLNELILLMVE